MNELRGRLPGGDSVRLRWDGGRITEIAPVGEAPDVWIVPGLFDIQMNGFRGHDVNAPDVTAETVTALTSQVWSAGVSRYCPTIVTAPETQIIRSLRAVADARAADPAVACAIPFVHVEGPHISAEDGPRGCHDAACIRPPDVAELHRWSRAASGLIGIVTLAPETRGAIPYIRELVRRGVVAAIGHTAAGVEDVRAAVEAGATLSTHLGNATHLTLPRHPNQIWEQLAEDRLFAGFIADGHHLDPAALKAMLRAKGPERAILVSDATAMAGLPPGRYRTPVGGLVELSGTGRLSPIGSPMLAGSAVSLVECVRTVVRTGCAGFGDAIRMATRNPARLLGLEPGAVEPGAPADLAVFRYGPGQDPEVVAIVVDGDVRQLGNDGPISGSEGYGDPTRDGLSVASARRRRVSGVTDGRFRGLGPRPSPYAQNPH